jgi:hypothetical protein
VDRIGAGFIRAKFGKQSAMKLYEALGLKITLQAQLKQLISLRNRTQEYPEDEQPEFNFDALTSEIKSVVKKLSKLKMEIAKVNMDTTLSNGKTLFESIIELQNLRSTVSQLEELMHLEGKLFWGSERRTKKEDVKMRRQKDSPALLAMLNEYRSRKNAMDSLIQEANHRIEIPEP